MLSRGPDRGKTRTRMIKIHLLRNGDTGYKGSAMRFDPKKYTSFMIFLDDVTTLLKKNVFIHIGGVRCLYDTDGKKIHSHLNLEDNKMYVAACQNETFRDVPYLQAPSPTSVTRSITSRESVYSSYSSKSVAKDYVQGDSFHAKRITIVRAGNRPRKIARVLLNSRNAHDFERVMTVINEATKFDSAPLHSLYTLGGNLVSSLDDIFGRHFIFFSFRKEAICLVKDLRLTEDEVQTVIQLNKSPNSDKISLKEPARREPESWKVMPQIALKYDLTMVIGTGEYSTVHKCAVKMRKDDGVRYAMKITRKNKTTYASLTQELQILKGIRHPNIVRLISVVDSASQVYLMYELLDRDLKALLNDEGKLAEEEAKLFVENIMSALFYIHCLKIVHRGVTLKNLMITTTATGVRTMKLIDFGLACRSFKPLYEICGETTFLAPEMVTGEGYGEKLDVWAVGVVLYYMLSLSAPFLGHDEDEDKRLIVEEKYDVTSEDWRNISGNAKHIIGRMLCKNVDKRYTADKILSHSWITGKSIDGFGNYDEGLSVGDGASHYGSDTDSVIDVSLQNKMTLNLPNDGKGSAVDLDSDQWEDETESVSDGADCLKYEQDFECPESRGAGGGDVGMPWQG